MKRKSVVSLNDPREAEALFAASLMPAVDVRGHVIEADFGDFFHICERHEAIRRRVGWIHETLKNPEAIYSHWDVIGREVCVNTVHEGEDDILGTMVVVVIAVVMGQRKLWTAFVPSHPEAYRQRIESGELLWKAP